MKVLTAVKPFKSIRNVQKKTLVQLALEILRKTTRSPAGIFVSGLGYLQQLDNKLTWSMDLSNPAYVLQGGASKSGQNLLMSAATDGLYHSCTIGVGPITLSYTLSGSGRVYVWGYNATDGTIGLTPIDLTATPTVYVINITPTVANTTWQIGRTVSGTASSVTLGACGEHPGTYTASQIAALGIPWTMGSASVAISTNGNKLRNSTMQGASIGVAPTYWSVTSANGITGSVVGVGTGEQGPYIDVRFSGVASATTYPSILFESSSQIAAAAGQVWVSSVYVSVAAGSLAGSNLQYVEVKERDAGGADLSTSSISSFAAVGATPVRFQVSRTLTNASCQYVLPTLVIRVQAGQSVDVTLRISAPQLEQSSYATAYTPTYGTAVNQASVACPVYTNAHVYLPGAGGVAVSGLNTNNYTLSDGSTGYSSVDDTAGLVLDGMGSVVPMSAPSTGGTAGWTAYLSTMASNGTDLTISNTGAAEGYGYFQHGNIIAGLTYRIQLTVVSRSMAAASSLQVGQTIVALPASGLFQATVKATNTHGIWIGAGAGAGSAIVIRDVTLSEITGIHLKQATTSNKCAVRQTAGRYRWEFDSTDLLTATYPAGYEAATIIDAKSTGHVTTQNQNIVGSYSMGPSATLYGRIVLKTSPTAAELTVLQRFANMLSGAS